MVGRTPSAHPIKEKDRIPLLEEPRRPALPIIRSVEEILDRSKFGQISAGNFYSDAERTVCRFCDVIAKEKRARHPVPVWPPPWIKTRGYGLRVSPDGSSCSTYLVEVRAKARHLGTGQLFSLWCWTQQLHLLLGPVKSFTRFAMFWVAEFDLPTYTSSICLYDPAVGAVSGVGRERLYWLTLKQPGDSHLGPICSRIKSATPCGREFLHVD